MPVTVKKRSANTERELPISSASSATVQLRPGSRCMATMALPRRGSRSPFSQPGENAGETRALVAGLALHGIEHGTQLRITVEQGADKHHVGHCRDERLHAAEFELHASAEDQCAGGARTRF